VRRTALRVRRTALRVRRTAKKCVALLGGEFTSWGCPTRGRVDHWLGPRTGLARKDPSRLIKLGTDAFGSIVAGPVHRLAGSGFLYLLDLH
jgi:hypothetical protein